MARVQVVKAIEAIEYDGSNAQEILDAFDPAKRDFYQVELVSEADNQAHFTYDDGLGNPRTLTLDVGDWMPAGENEFGFWPISRAGLGPYVIVGQP